ncbi:hypothetical protein WG66_001296 [Moniliophthora roreri]|nr:hypothetical protein WG66_001296 [Moniliophthora roreri]
MSSNEFEPPASKDEGISRSVSWSDIYATFLWTKIGMVRDYAGLTGICRDLAILDVKDSGAPIS